MEFTKKESVKVNLTRVADSYSLTCFQEHPRKTGDEKPLSELGLLIYLIYLRPTSSVAKRYLRGKMHSKIFFI